MNAQLAAFAADVGPQLDRLRLGVMRASVDAAATSGVLATSGLDPDTTTVFAMLRNAYPARAVPLRSYQAVYVYQDPGRFEAALAQMVRSGLVDVASGETVTLSAGGAELIHRMRAVGARAAESLWGTGPLPVLALADRCLSKAAASAATDGAFHLVAPPHDEPGDSDAAKLAERLTGLRFHRFDAHVAAWTAAGLTVSSVADLAPGSLRDRIEASTNALAGQAYADLSADERTSLLDGLRGLG